MTFKNMKIEVNAEQPLEEIVKELMERGYRNLAQSSKNDDVVLVYTRNMTFYSMNQIYPVHGFKLTTLAELKEM